MTNEFPTDIDQEVGADEPFIDETTLAVYGQHSAGAVKKGQSLGPIARGDELGDRPPIVAKEDILNTAILVHAIESRPIIGDRDTGEVAYQLVSVLAQPVALERDGETVKRAGRLLIFHAGRVDEPGKPNGVLADEFLAMAADPDFTVPTLLEHGITKRVSGGGLEYFTTRPETARANIDIWGDDD